MTPRRRLEARFDASGFSLASHRAPVVRASRALDAIRLAGLRPDRLMVGVAVRFKQPGCLIAQSGPQLLLSAESWVGGEEELLVTMRLGEPSPLFVLHKLIHSPTALLEHQLLDLDHEQANWFTSAAGALPLAAGLAQDL